MIGSAEGGVLLRELRKYWSDAVAAVSPIMVVIIILQLTVARLPWTEFIQFLIGLAFVLVGMFIFLIGSEVGLEPLGRLLGSLLPTPGSLPFFLIGSFILGFLVVVAEPQVRVLAFQFADVSGVEVSVTVFVGMIAVGVGLIAALGMYRIVKGISIRRNLALGYLAVLILGLFTPAEFLPLAFDSGAITTGPVTVPLILSLAAGTASVLEGRDPLADGFGLIGLIMLGPIAAVMVLGVMLG